MEIYLPIAEMSVHWLIILGMGLGVGFLSGLFGVGGGFLLTPLLVFYGIPSSVAVATTLSHITASSISGALAQWRKRAIDFKMAGVMLAGGFIGTVVRRLAVRADAPGRADGPGGLAVLCGAAGRGRRHDAERKPGDPAGGARRRRRRRAGQSCLDPRPAASRCAFASRGSISASSRRS